MERSRRRLLLLAGLTLTVGFVWLLSSETDQAVGHLQQHVREHERIRARALGEVANVSAAAQSDDE